MPVTVVLGSQWGDEGKGKIVDLLSQNADVVARYQGGANAGHTVVHNGRVDVLHLIPSGILNPDCACILGSGMVIDPTQLLTEIEELKVANVSVKDRLFVSHRAHLIMPYHKILDGLNLLEYFEVIAAPKSPAEAFKRKPSATLFLEALDSLGLGPSDAAHVGDRLKRDIKGANDVGLISIHAKYGEIFSDNGFKCKADYEINAFDELLGVVHSINQKT